MAFQGIRRGYIALSSNADPSLKNLIEEEKDCVNSMRKLSKEIGEASNYMLKWGDEEHLDLKDLSTHFSRFSKDTEKAIVDLSDSYSDYRKKLKEILKMTSELKELQKKHASSAEKLKKHNKSGKGPDNKLEKEEEDSNMAVLEFIANYECEKRKMLQEGLNIQFKGWEMFSNRIGVISHFGLHMANQIPQGKLGPGDVLPPYTGIMG
jgi:DNA repair ATPase RecN